MSSVTILRALWRHRVSVGLITLLAVFAGWTLTYGPSFPPQRRSYDVGVASASILVDTPRSQVVEVAPKGSDELGARANVLANLMVDGEIRNVIARRAGLRPERLIASSQSPDGASAAPALNARSYAYTTSVVLTSDLTSLPIIRVQSQAPDVRAAIKLTNNVVTGLGDYLDSKAADETVSESRRLRVRALGTAQGQEVTRGPTRIMGLLVAIVVFLTCCAAILGVSALVRGWRTAAAAEHETADPQGTPEASSEEDALEQREWPAPRHSEPTKLRAW